MLVNFSGPFRIFKAELIHTSHRPADTVACKKVGRERERLPTQAMQTAPTLCLNTDATCAKPFEATRHRKHSRSSRIEQDVWLTKRSAEIAQGN